MEDISVSDIEESHVEKVADEINDDYSTEDLYNISSYGADLSFRELISMYKEDELAKPELQRNYVWDKVEASRFIESLLLGLPVPSIFLAKSKGEKKLIVDGYQRIMTVYDYVEKGVFSKDGKDFKLANSKNINKKWRNKSFRELAEADQRRIRSTTIHAIIFEQKEPRESDSSMYQIFQRINTSGRTLLPQEIRNCVSQGPFNTLLIKLNAIPVWRKLYGLTSSDTRMRDMEFILRFFALQPGNIPTDTATISMKQHLDSFMEINKKIVPEVAAGMEKEFVSTMNFLYENFGEDAFHNLSKKGDGSFTDKFHPTVFDALAVSTNIAKNRGIGDATKNKLLAERLKLLNDAQFGQFIRFRTTDVTHIHGRIGSALQYLYAMKYE